MATQSCTPQRPAVAPSDMHTLICALPDSEPQEEDYDFRQDTAYSSKAGCRTHPAASPDAVQRDTAATDAVSPMLSQHASPTVLAQEVAADAVADAEVLPELLQSTQSAQPLRFSAQIPEVAASAAVSQSAETAETPADTHTQQETHGQPRAASPPPASSQPAREERAAADVDSDSETHPTSALLTIVRSACEQEHVQLTESDLAVLHRLATVPDAVCGTLGHAEGGCPLRRQRSAMMQALPSAHPVIDQRQAVSISNSYCSVGAQVAQPWTSMLLWASRS